MCGKVKKILILSSVLGITGIAGFGWVLLERNKEKQLLCQQQEMLNTTFIKLDKLLSGEISIQSFADTVREENWQEESARRQARKRTIRPLILSASTTCVAIGATTFACWSLLWIARCAIAGLSHLKKFFVHISIHRRHTEDNQLNEPVRSRANLLGKNKSHSNDLAEESEKIDSLYCDEKSLTSKEQSKFVSDYAGLNAKLSDQLEQNIRKSILSGYRENGLMVEDLLKDQNENLEKQATEFRQMLQAVEEVAVGHSEPLKTSLTELTQEVSAIREYVFCQRDRIERLQEGYDWNVIRTFCLRVIRCIDNLENRIAQLSEQDIDTTDLEEIMDELLFALESSGVEQFEPEINSNYSGQEKTAEVLKDKVRPNAPKMRGKIAEVIQPGYQYVFGDENVKVVRTARVKLFG